MLRETGGEEREGGGGEGGMKGEAWEEGDECRRRGMGDECRRRGGKRGARLHKKETSHVYIVCRNVLGNR